MRLNDPVCTVRDPSRRGSIREATKAFPPSMANASIFNPAAALNVFPEQERRDGGMKMLWVGAVR